MRKTLIVVHRWVALIVGIVLMGTAASGAALVFEGAIDRGLHPELWRVTPAGAFLPIDTVIARVEAKYPGPGITGITVSSVRDRAWTANVDRLGLYIDPYTGAVIGTRTPEAGGASLARRLHVFHVELFSGKVGRSIVAIVTIVALFLVLTGIILWWPDKLIRVNTSASWKRVNFDLHHALGIVAAIVMIVITSSGLWIHYDGIGKLIKSLDSAPAVTAPTQPAGPSDAPRPSFDAMAAAARAALPGADISFVSLGTSKNPVTVALKFPDDHTPAGRSRVFIDRYTGKVLAVMSTHDAGLGTRLDYLKRSIHTGDVLGKPTEAIWLLASIVMFSQVVTGFLMWWNARRART